MILVVGNTKGGVGKSAFAVNIAAVLAGQGKEVLLIDGDEQASAATFAAIRAELPQVKASFTTVQLQGAAIRQQARQLRDKYDEIVIDVGGRDTGSLRAALTVADTLLVPVQPRSVDLWAVAKQMAELVGEAREINPGLRALSVLNAADSQGRDNDDAAGALRAIAGIDFLPCVVVRRKAFPNAFSEGLSVIEQSPKDQKAIDELLSVVNSLYTHKVGNGYQNATQRAAS
jgi:chromosome partitioning protein